MIAPFIAVDWGTTNRRAFVIGADGAVLQHLRDDRGVLRIAPDAFAAEVAMLRATLGDLPMLLAGMVGGARGWVNLPYRPCPADIADLARHVHWVEPGRTTIVPGLADPAGDVMRGEEVQVLGAVAAQLAPPDGLMCQPGTHCKWARVVGGRLVQFSTAMTGELFALLKHHSLLADFLDGTVTDGPAFQAGVDAGLTQSLTTALFRVRAAALLGLRDPADAAAYTSGLLIGHDVGGATDIAAQTVHIIGDPPLDALYASAITRAGGTPHHIESTAAFVAGMAQIWRVHHDA